LLLLLLLMLLLLVVLVLVVVAAAVAVAVVAAAVVVNGLRQSTMNGREGKESHPREQLDDQTEFSSI
jgi:hypothetical protein